MKKHKKLVAVPGSNEEQRQLLRDISDAQAGACVRALAVPPKSPLPRFAALGH